MAEVISFYDFAHSQCDEGELQWAVGIKGVNPSPTSTKVVADLSKANSRISEYFLCPGPPEYANMLIRGTGGELQGRQLLAAPL